MDWIDRLMPWFRRAGWAYALLGVSLAVAGWRLAARDAAPQPTSPPAAVTVRQEPREYLVHVAGAVRRPGVYRIGGDTRVIQAVRLAGGPTSAANLAALNLAAPVQDGQQIVVPQKTPAGTGAPSTVGTPPTGPVQLSTATAEQLEALDGIGPALAARIVAWRARRGPPRRLEDLLDVPGIGEARLEALRGSVVP